MKIDKFEFENQRKEEVLKNGKYIKLEVIIPTATSSDNAVIPIVEFEVQKVNTLTMMCLYNIFDLLKEQILKRYPEIKLSNLFFNTKVVETDVIEKGDFYETQD